MAINSAGLIEKLPKDIAFLESLLYPRTVVSNDERLEESQEVQVRLRNEIERNYQLVIRNNECSAYIIDYYEACVRYDYFKTVNRKVAEFLRMSDL